jgi:hypothetical protein
MQDPNKPRVLPESLFYKLLIAGAIALTCAFILSIRYFLKPQDAASGTASERNNVFNSNPGPLSPELPQAKAPNGVQGSSLEMLQNANKGSFAGRTSAPFNKTAPASKPPGQ